MAASRSAEFNKAFIALSTTVGRALNKYYNAAGTGMTADLYPAQGRVFDRIMLQRRDRGKAKGKPEVLLFVRISDGQIFGPKSDIAPNLNWWYGDLSTVDAWNWADPFHPVPKNPDDFRLIKAYAGHFHYIPKGMHVRLPDRVTPLPSERKKRVKA